MNYTEKQTLHSRHGSVSFFLLLLLSTAAAQPSPPQSNNGNLYPRFSPSMAVIIAVLVAALFFMGFFSIYIRHCYDAPGRSGVGSVGRGLSMRGRRAAAARGLDRSTLETFPTFSYSEVKDHKIGKGALECAVCLNEFEDDETLRLLPKCDHVFHPECIDAWLESHVTCPVCRANLVQQDEAETDTTTAAVSGGDDVLGRSRSRNEEVVVQVDADDQPQPERNPSFEPPSRTTTRSWSIGRPKMLGLGKFRSHSTGHSLVQPGENLDRFTLRLPEVVRKEVIDRAMLNRSRSLAIGLQREGSSRKGYRNGGEEGTSRVGRLYQKIEVPGREANSDRWAFFTRGLSFRSPRVVTDRGEGSGSKRGGGNKSPVKMPSFKCLEPKTDGGDEKLPFSGRPSL